MTDFATWWSNEGSAMRPRPDEDVEEFAKRVTQIAWSNGEYVEREAWATLEKKLQNRRAIFQAGRDSYQTACAPHNSDDEAWEQFTNIRSRAKP